MQIYTGICCGEKLEKIKELGLGIMVSSHRTVPVREDTGSVPCALDNGAFSAWQMGYPFNEFVFLKTIDKCADKKIKLDFIVVPDVVGGGRKSLDFSEMWLDRLTSNNLALAIQDGFTDWWIRDRHLDRISHIFLGGTVEWKWKNAKYWRDFAKANDKKFHIGQCGRLEFLQEAERLGADSCDSASFVRNESWHILEEFLNPKQFELIPREEKQCTS